MADDAETVVAQFSPFHGEANETTGPQLNVPRNITPEQLLILLNKFLEKDEDEVPYSFFVDDTEIVASLGDTIGKLGTSTEQVLQVLYQPQAVFRVKAVTRLSASMPGHTEAILAVQFSPDGKALASGSGDCTVRFWDMNTQTPLHTCKGHKNWVLAIAWSPDGKKLASAGMDCTLRLWHPETGQPLGRVLTGHTKHINCIAWEPYHRDPECRRIATGSKDATVRIWDTVTGQCLFTISGHTMAVTCMRWGGAGLLYTGSQDRSIKVYDVTTANGKLVRTLAGHAHWVNTMALSTDYAMRTGAYDHTGELPANPSEAAQKRYDEAKGRGGERMVSGSDDFTLYLWTPESDKKPLCRMTGHQQPVNLVCFSPNGRLIASASFDKSLKLWDGITGKFLSSLRGHVGAVYQVAWSADSRQLISGSKDSTLKLWNMSTKKCLVELPGHADEVYAVDWSPDGSSCASGSKDRLLKVWRP